VEYEPEKMMQKEEILKLLEKGETYTFRNHEEDSIKQALASIGENFPDEADELIERKVFNLMMTVWHIIHEFYTKEQKLYTFESTFSVYVMPSRYCYRTTFWVEEALFDFLFEDLEKFNALAQEDYDALKSYLKDIFKAIRKASSASLERRKNVFLAELLNKTAAPIYVQKIAEKDGYVCAEILGSSDIFKIRQERIKQQVKRGEEYVFFNKNIGSFKSTFDILQRDLEKKAPSLRASKVVRILSTVEAALLDGWGIQKKEDDFFAKLRVYVENQEVGYLPAMSFVLCFWMEKEKSETLKSDLGALNLLVIKSDGTKQIKRLIKRIIRREGQKLRGIDDRPIRVFKQGFATELFWSTYSPIFLEALQEENDRVLVALRGQIERKMPKETGEKNTPA
jgi:hypothetical protein